jgi:hypothetical protein
MKLSIVYAVRDPEYGHGLLNRMQVSLNTLTALAKRCKLDYELVVVEWNPPPGKKTVRETISVPYHARSRLRFIEVPPAVHDTFEADSTLPFLEYAAKNAGIRRAHGEWILATSPDVVFNEPLVRFLAKGKLAGGCFYRIDRRDVAGSIPVDASAREVLARCRESVFVVHGLEGSYRPTAEEPTGPSWLRRLLSRPEEPAFAESRLHTNASGDFLLMSKENWFNLRAYTEERTHAHIDSIMCWTATTAGVQQMVLEGQLRLYHQDHDRSTHAEFPPTDLELWQGRFEDAIERGEVLIVNDGRWGLAGQELPEYLDGARRGG